MSNILPINPCPYFDNYYAYEKYCKKVEDRICKLIEKGWDSEEFADYQASEMTSDEIYRFAHETACEQVYEEIKDVGFDEP